MHYVLRQEQICPLPAYVGHSEGFKRASLVDRRIGSAHIAQGLCELSAGGRIDNHLQSFEESFYILEGEPTLILDGCAYRLLPGACGLIPVGVPHAWSGPAQGVARWIDMLAPQPREDVNNPDLFFVPAAANIEQVPLDIRDPRSRNFFRMVDADIDVDRLKVGARVDAPTVSASMATALLAYSGIAVKMLVNQRLDAQLHTMFMVDYQPGGVAHPHDHPLEEAYIILEGEVDAVGDGQRYTLRTGDVFWTGVGCIHAFYNTTDQRVRWLETQSPQPPHRYSYRFSRDWEYLQQKLGAAATVVAS